MNRYVLTALISGVLSAFSQILLKKGSSVEYDSKIREYVNPYVISGYALTFTCMFVMIYAYRGIEFKLGAVLESLVYFYVMVLGKIFFNERLTVKRIVGNLLIVLGVAVFSL